MSDLFPSIFYGDLELTAYPYAVVMDYELGSGQVAYETLVSNLLDGELVASTRTGNRELKLTVQVEGATLLDIAENAAALTVEADKARNTLTIDPGDGFAVSTAFDTFTAQVDQQRNDMHEQNLVRLYDLTIPALPFARSTELTVQPAVTVDSTLTIIDDCSSAANWTSLESAPVSSSGAVVTTEANGDGFAGMTRTGTISMAGKPYLVFDWSTSVPANLVVFLRWKDEAMRGPSPFGAGWTRSYYYIPEGFDSTGVDFSAATLPAGATMSITQVAIAKSLPDADTGGHQQSLAILPGGSARTQAQIEVSTPTNSLGEVTLFTAPMGQAYTPTIRRWLVSSDTIITNPAGSYQTITGASVFHVPVSTLPEGGYSIWARMACTTTTEVGIVWNAKSQIGTTAVGDSQGDTTRCSFTANIWKMYPLGLVTLPPAKVGPAGTVRVGIQREAGTATVYLYDVFLFHENGDLTVVQCDLGTASSGGPSRRLRVLPPSADNPGGLLERGHSADWSDAFAAGAKATFRPARGHVMHPEGTSAFLFTEGTPDGSPASVSASWHKRWRTYAAED